jgi:hypothetical protein
MPKQILDEIEPDLQRFGQRVLGDIAAMGDDVENPNHYPQLKQYDAWCRSVFYKYTKENVTYTWIDEWMKSPPHKVGNS